MMNRKDSKSSSMNRRPRDRPYLSEEALAESQQHLHQHRPKRIGSLSNLNKSSAGRVDMKLQRMKKDISAMFPSMKDLAYRVRHSRPHNTTENLLQGWAEELLQFVEMIDGSVFSVHVEAEDIIADSKLLTRLHGNMGQEDEPSMEDSTLKKKRAGSGVFSTVQQVVSRQRKSEASVSPHRRGSRMSNGGAVPSPLARKQSMVLGPPKEQRPEAIFGKAPSSSFHDSGRGALVIGPPRPANNQRINILAKSMFTFLDSAMRAVSAERCVVHVPFHGDAEDLRAVCAAGYGPDAILADIRCRDPASAQQQCLRTGVMVVVMRGLNPPAVTQLHDGLQQLEGAARGQGASTAASLGAEGVRKFAPAAKSKYWSSIVLPVRETATAPVMGVLSLHNKNNGRANFDADDESIAFGIANVVAMFFSRCNDFELLADAFDAQLALPPTVRPPPVHVAGNRKQLVYHTSGVAGGKDVKILTDTDEVQKLDEQVPLTRVADYILKLQQSWKSAVTLNIELKKSNEQRSKAVAALMRRARTAEARLHLLDPPSAMSAVVAELYAEEALLEEEAERQRRVAAADNVSEGDDEPPTPDSASPLDEEDQDALAEPDQAEASEKEKEVDEAESLASTQRHGNSGSRGSSVACTVCRAAFTEEWPRQRCHVCAFTCCARYTCSLRKYLGGPAWDPSSTSVRLCVECDKRTREIYSDEADAKRPNSGENSNRGSDENDAAVDVRCFNCNQAGHFTSQCPEPMKSPRSIGNKLIRKSLEQTSSQPRRGK